MKLSGSKDHYLRMGKKKQNNKPKPNNNNKQTAARALPGISATSARGEEGNQVGQWKKARTKKALLGSGGESQAYPSGFSFPADY